MKEYLSKVILITLFLPSTTFVKIELEQKFETARLNQMDLVEEEDEILDIRYLKERTKLEFEDKCKRYSLGMNSIKSTIG